MPVAAGTGIGVERILVLGGTTEARRLVEVLAGDARFAVTLSLAGRTAGPREAPVPTRVGGFGGARGLADWLHARAIARVIDATHPFAARISHNAASACAQTRTPLLAIRRPAWEAEPGDRWIEVGDMVAAVEALGLEPRRVFLTIGRQELASFARAPIHDYVVRTIEPIGDALPVPRLVAIAARGPFTLEAETTFLKEEGIELLVSKNSGGAATFAKIAAARDLGLPIVMVRRPILPEVEAVTEVAAALAWLGSGGYAARRIEDGQAGFPFDQP